MTTAPAGLFDRRYFEKIYRDYERQNPAHKLRFYRRLLERYVAVEHACVLDVGCGPGVFLKSLSGGWRAFGLDVSEYAVRQARARMPDATLTVASALKVPFARTFDAVVALDVLEHLSDPGIAMAEIHERLADDGVFLFVVPVYDGFSGPAIRLLDRDPTHLHKRPRSFWLRLAAERFVVREWCGVFRYLLPGGAYLNWPTRRLRNHTPAIAVVAVSNRTAR